jgi:hypothetical protein
MGEFDIDVNTLKFGQAPFSQLLGIQYQVLNPGDALNLPGFYDNVAVASAINGQAINGPQNTFLVGGDILNIYNQVLGSQNYLVIQAPNLGVFADISPGGGDTIVVSGTAHNDGTYMVWQIVGGGLLTVKVPSAVTPETWQQFEIQKNQTIHAAGLALTPVAFVPGTGIGVAAGFFTGAAAGDLLSVIGSLYNDGLYHITSVASDGSAVSVTETLHSETDSHIFLGVSRDAAHGGTPTTINPALPSTTFAATGAKITSAAGSFADVLVGDLITISGSSSNNTGAGYVANGGSSIGATSIPITGGSGQVPVGAVLIFAGDPNYYTVNSALSGGNVGITPGLVQTLTTGAAVAVTFPITAIATDLSWVTVGVALTNETSSSTYIAFNDQGWSGWFSIGDVFQTVNVLEFDVLGTSGLAITDGSGNVNPLSIEVDVEYQGLSVQGTGFGYLANGAQSIGATSIPINTGTGTVPTGCVVTFGTDPTTYTVTAGVTGPGTITISPALNVALTNGEAMTVADPGTPAGSIFTYRILASASQTSAYRRSFPWNNNTGFANVQVRFRRTTPQASLANSQVLDALTVGGVRGYCPNLGVYPGCTVIAIKAQATGQLTQQQTQQVNLVATRKVPIWNGTTWSAPTATDSIAWALADMLRSGQPGYATAYGAKLLDAQIDLGALLALDGIWSGRGDSASVVFDQASTIWEQLVNLARAGRAQPVLSDGIITFVRDSAATVPVAMFTPAQMTPGSLSIQYLMPQDNDPDGTSVGYIDPTTWGQRTLDLIDGSASLPVQPQSITLFGVTNLAQATREVTYLDRVRKYQRKLITFETEMDGHLVNVGDLIVISHDVPAWGQSGELVAVSGTTFTCSDPLNWTGSGFQVSFRKPDGTVAGPFSVTAGGSPNQFVCTATLGFTPATDLSAGDRTTFTFGPSTGFVQKAKVQSVAPGQGTTVQITATPYVDAVYAAGA